MDLTISVTLLAKCLLFVIGGVFLAAITLWPINDQPTSKTQFAVFGVVGAIFAAFLFGGLRLHFGA